MNLPRTQPYPAAQRNRRLSHSPIDALVNFVVQCGLCRQIPIWLDLGALTRLRITILPQWRPERGQIGIFNRSYYEEVLIVRVHPEILRAQGLPDQRHNENTIWLDRYRSITDLENHLYRNGTRIIKFFLHLSQEEQRKRFLARIDEPEKNWKFSLADIEERKFWKQYRQAYEACLSATSTKNAPWYVVPADDKENARLIVSEIILDTFKALKLRYPETDATHRQELQLIRAQLMQQAPGSR